MKKRLVLNRIFASIYDSIIVCALCLLSIIPSVVSFINVLVDDSTINSVALYISAFFGGGISLAVFIVYCVLVPVFWNGQTLGKRLFGIKTEKINGNKVDIKSMFLRTVLRGVIFFSTFGLSLIIDLITLCSKEHLTFYDILASTIVVDAKK